MGLDFVKMHGLGNDFVIINNVGSPPIYFSQDEIINICNRNIGIGCDQLIILESAADADCNMLIYNPDGSKSGACGNATRCVAKLLNASAVRVGDRRLKTTVHADGDVTVDMGAYTGLQPMGVLGYGGYFVDVGNPHFVYFGEDMDISEEGAKLARNPIFPTGANINNAYITGSNSINLSVWERGAGQTLACGSGACATAITAHRFLGLESQIDITLKGGTLRITVGEDSVLMHGAAEKVFTGSWDKYVEK